MLPLRLYSERSSKLRSVVRKRVVTADFWRRKQNDYRGKKNMKRVKLMKAMTDTLSRSHRGMNGTPSHSASHSSTGTAERPY